MDSTSYLALAAKKKETQEKQILNTNTPTSSLQYLQSSTTCLGRQRSSSTPPQNTASPEESQASFSCRFRLSRTELTPTAIHYFTEGSGLMKLLLQLFSVIGGVFMIIKVVDAYFTALFTKSEEFSEFSPGTELS